MNKILIPTDFSDCALNAAITGVALAQKFQAEIHLFSKIMPHEYFDYYSKSEQEDILQNEELKQRINGKFDSFIKKMNVPKGQHIIRSYTHKDTIDQILNYKNGNEIDLIVMGTHGTSGVSEWAIGSITQKIVRRANCPVLAVKELPKTLAFKNIVFVSDFNKEAIPAFNQICAFASKFESTIHLLNIDTPNYFLEIPFVITESMKDFQILYSGKTEIHRTSAWSVEHGIKKFLKEVNADLVIIPTHQKKGIQSVFFNSIAEGIVNHLNCPVMTIKL